MKTYDLSKTAKVVYPPLLDAVSQLADNRFTIQAGQKIMLSGPKGEMLVGVGEDGRWYIEINS